MKRTFFLAALLAGLPGVSSSSGGQDPDVAKAAKEDAEEHYKAMNARLDGFDETLGVVRKHLTKLEDELGRLRDEVTRLSGKNNDAATKESLERLTKAIKEVDDKRQSDNDKVLAALTALQRGFEKPAEPVERLRPPTPVNPPIGPRNGSSGGGHTAPPPRDNAKVEMKGYTVQNGDTFSGIVAKLRSAGIKVTLKQIEDANSGVKSTSLKIGQQIIIPVPVP